MERREGKRVRGACVNPRNGMNLRLTATRPTDQKRSSGFVLRGVKQSLLRAGPNHPVDGAVFHPTRRVAMSTGIIECARMEALFVSEVQPSDALSAEQVRAAVRRTVRR